MSVPNSGPRSKRVRVVQLQGDPVVETYADVRAWPLIRYRLYAFFRCCAEAARMTGLYGQRTAEQVKYAFDYSGSIT